MKIHHLLLSTALASAFVLPDQQTFSELEIQTEQKAESIVDRLSATKDKAIQYVQDTFKQELESVEQFFENALASSDNDNEYLVSSFEDYKVGAEAWMDYSAEQEETEDDDDHDHPHPPPHHPGWRPPHHPGEGPPHHPGDKPPHHGPPGKGPHHRPHHPPHHHKPNLTIYQLISKSKYTTKLAKLIDEDKDLVKLLNSTKANHTIFAPTDYAFSKIPEDAPKPSKELLKKVLLYHVAPGLYPAGRILYEKTVPSSLEEKKLGDHPQRIAARVGLKGVTLNFYARVIAINIPATNGIIHGIDSLLLPPPPAIKIFNALPTVFSTALYAVEKTGLKNMSFPHSIGHTYFAPTNEAFRRLGPRINAFLFSPAGEKYLKALLLYHVVGNQTVYSTAYYNGTEKDAVALSKPWTRKGCHQKKVRTETYPYFHFDLPTYLPGRSLAVDVGRWGPFVEIKINAFTRVSVADGVAQDGVIHLPERLLIPPRTVPGTGIVSFWQGEDMELEDFQARFAPYVEADEEVVEENLEL